MQQIKTLTFYCALFALMFGIVSLVFFFGDWIRLLSVTAVGFFVGFVAAPVFEPELFAKPRLIQIMGGLIAGATLGLAVNLDAELIFYLSLLGGVVGFLADYWIKHLQIP